MRQTGTKSTAGISRPTTLATFVGATLLLALAVAGRSTQRATAQESGSNWLLELFDHRGADIGDGIPMWGYSAFIRYNDHTILFDGGTSAKILEHNARTYGVDLRDVDFAMVSHSHGDHTAGIDYLLEVNPSVRLYVPRDGSFGYPMEEGKEYRPGYRYQTDNMVFVGENTEIEEGVHLIHTTSPHTGSFSRYPPHEDEPMLFNLPELSLALETESGDIVVISGCSHSGIEKIVKEAMRATGADVELVTGGFHLGPYSAEYVTELAHMMKDELAVHRAAPTHCTGDEAIEIFRQIYGADFVEIGLGTRIPLPQ